MTHERALPGRPRRGINSITGGRCSHPGKLSAPPPTWRRRVPIRARLAGAATMSGTVRCRAGSRDAAGRPGTNRKSVWSMQISWVTLDRLCQQQAGADPVIGRMLTRSGRPLRSNAEQLTDADLLDKLRSFGIDLDREGLSKTREDQLMTENCRRALAESYSEAGLTGKA